MLECKDVYYETPDDLPVGAFYPLGGFEPPPDWDNYLSQYHEDMRPYLEAARQWLLGLEIWPGASDFAAERYLTFSDGASMAFSWRAFGDFAQAVAGRQQGYLEYYLSTPNPFHSKADPSPDPGAD